MGETVVQAWREVRRAPARILTSIFALALAIGAIGVFAIPAVSTSSLRAAAERDGIPEIVFHTSDTGTIDVAATLADVANVDRAEPQVAATASFGAGIPIDVLGLDIGSQEMDVLRADEGRLPARFGEVVVTAGMAEIGSTFDVVLPDGSHQLLMVVGIGGSAFWNESQLAFSDLETAAAVGGIVGANRVVVRAEDDSKDVLRSTANSVRDELSAIGVTTQTLPFTIADGRHPVEADIEQISSLIGFLGIVAGLVALVLLGSTANTLITERTREVAVMRALGARDRTMRRRLRRLALGIAVAAVVIGVPLGVLISNVIARMVLQEFVGLTPGVAVSVPVMVASALFAVVGARLVAANAARRVTRRPLAEALRDRSGSPFGRRWSERLAVRFGVGHLLDRTALRNGLHQRARSVAIGAQIGAAVAALMIIASMATTITDYNAAVIEPFRWSSRTFVRGPGLDIARSVVDEDPRSEIGTEVAGEVEGWEIGVLGFERDTQMIDRTMDEGRWFENAGEVAVSKGFAERVGIDIGDEIAVELGSGEHTYTVVGLHPDRDRSVFIDVDELALDMSRPGFGNVVMSLDDQPPAYVTGHIEFERFADLRDDDGGRTAILLIFAAIGAVVVSVAGLAVASGLAVNVFERRHEFAALRAIGGRRRDVFRVVVAELLPIAAGGTVFGLIAGYFGGAAIAGSFEASNAVEIGFTYASGVVPVAAVVVIGAALSIGAFMVRQVTRRPVAVTLRGAA